MSQTPDQAADQIAPDWVASALVKAQPITLDAHEETLATTLIEQAFGNASATSTPVGLSLAAAFDLFVAVEYYRSVTNQGWLYCPQGDPLLLYPFTNTCPRCVLHGEFHFHKSNKPESGSIGTTTSRLLCVFLDRLFARAKREMRIYRGVEPVDMILHDPQREVVLLAEVKAAPLTTLALAVRTDPQTGMGPDGVTALPHSPMDNPFLTSSELDLILPLPEDGDSRYGLIPLGVRGTTPPGDWAYNQIYRLFGEEDRLFANFFHFWSRAFRAYNRAARQRGDAIDPVNWLTNGCGQPSPRPSHWPRRSGSGYESISDGKSSVGMDRTDDIKKGIYQVLKIGAASKPNSRIEVKTTLISNIHAVRHYDEYLRDLQDVVWTLDTVSAEGTERFKAKTAGDLPKEAPIYNLFDGIISFTQNHPRDAWIEDTFTF